MNWSHKDKIHLMQDTLDRYRLLYNNATDKPTQRTYKALIRQAVMQLHKAERKHAEETKRVQGQKTN